MIKASIPIMRALGPLVRLYDKAIINPVEVPATVLAEMACDEKFAHKSGYFLLDEEKGATDTAKDETIAKKLWVETVEILAEKGFEKWPLSVK